jgi:hypothetical protein
MIYLPAIIPAFLALIWAVFYIQDENGRWFWGPTTVGMLILAAILFAAAYTGSIQ